MIVQRVTHRVKQGCMDEFLALIKRMQTVENKRTYTPNIVPDASVVVNEMEVEDLAELDKAWAAWWADPKTPAYMEEYNKLTEGWGSEVWNLED